MTTWITVCDTCKTGDWQIGSEKTDGARLAELVENTATPLAPQVQVRRFSCLMGCSRACNVTIQAEGKLAYTLSEFAPIPEAADAIVAYARLHADSTTGQVPYRSWPAGVKGHFAARHLPLPDAPDLPGAAE
ncbi:DUF1636 domain-containing protein [Pseudoruegeria sp. SK021]|uniref:DUF1636 family protein n=1 Tax=Pseudoruegeria sp. SK021 TaxID=1933035 RepID=UPI000A264A1D|nr:DUF1636 domain-containing protein [Pseudoruegeria sp. SK021]OSP51934.1 hypothetical protein BV911_18845 [Pseudoruegeria sp. SK021]